LDIEQEMADFFSLIWISIQDWEVIRWLGKLMFSCVNSVFGSSIVCLL